VSETDNAAPYESETGKRHRNTPDRVTHLPPPHAPPLTEGGPLRPTHAEVALDRLSANYRAIAAHVGSAVGVMPIVKANAYGHGLLAVAQQMVRCGASMLGVAVLKEAIRLREGGVTAPILVLGGVLDRQIPWFLHHNVTLAATSIDSLLAIDACAAAHHTRARVHLKIDTGMARLGVHWTQAEALLNASLTCKHVDVDGIFSHLANADAADPTGTATQLARFQQVLHFYPRHSLRPPLRHLASSAAIVRHPETWLDLVRPGLMLYGVYPSEHVPRTIPVRPALRWTSRVVYVKVIPPGDPVSYGSTWTPKTATGAVTVPVGYGDGYLRAMSDRAHVLLHGKRYPVRGRICMDQIVVTIGDDDAHNDDEIVLLGKQGDDTLTAEDLARWANTIPYEILTNISARVPRVYTGGI